MNNRVHWHRGLFLQPQVFQALQRSVYDEATKVRRFSTSYSHGVCELKLSADELANQRLRFEKLRVIMPSGLEVSFPENADLASFDLKPLAESGDSAFMFYLAVPLYQERRANTFPIGVHMETREKILFKPSETTLFDEITGDNPKSIFIQRINARLITDKDEHDDMEILPVLRVIRSTGEQLGALGADPEYIPPSVYKDSSHTLQLILQDLVNQMEVNRKELAVALTRTGFSAETMRGIQYEQQLRLRTLLRYCGRLVPLLKVPHTTPLAWYLELREVHGDLAALNPEKIEEDMPDYDHDNLHGIFSHLNAKIREMLKRSITASFLKTVFARSDFYFTASLDKDQVTLPIEYYLAIKSARDPKEVINLVQDPDQFKFMPRSMANRAIRGVPLKEERIPPLQLPAQAGLTYFKVERTEAQRAWQQIADEGEIAILWAEVADADFEMTLYMPLGDK
jgi:type VI secretion system ImpJ/VasE family protein